MYSLKQPSNLLEGPEYPQIKRQESRFVFTGKDWVVDFGKAVKDFENNSQFLDPFITHQSRDRGVTMYGISTHRDYVNKQVIYPTTTPYDYIPEHMKPTLPNVRDTLIHMGSPQTNPVTPLTFNNWKYFITNKIKPRIS